MKWTGRLPESELELMLAVWEAGEEGTTAPGILARLERPLTASALHSYLKRLEEKGFLSCGKEVGELLADIGVSLGAGGSPDGVHRVPLIFGRDLTAVGADNTGKAPRHCTLTSKSPECSSAAARMGS